MISAVDVVAQDYIYQIFAGETTELSQGFRGLSSGARMTAQAEGGIAAWVSPQFLDFGYISSGETKFRDYEITAPADARGMYTFNWRVNCSPDCDVFNTLVTIEVISPEQEVVSEPTISAYKSHYTVGDKIIINGNVGKKIPNKGFQIGFYKPDGELAFASVLQTPRSDGSFTYTRSIDNFFTQQGVWKILLKYGGSEIAEDTFQVSVSTSSTTSLFDPPTSELRKLFSGNVKSVPSHAYVNEEYGFSIIPEKKVRIYDIGHANDPTAFGLEFRADNYFLQIFLDEYPSEGAASFNLFKAGPEQISEQEFKESGEGDYYSVRIENFADAVKVSYFVTSPYQGDANYIYHFILNNGNVFTIAGGDVDGDVYIERLKKAVDSFYVGPVRVAEDSGGGCLIATATFGSELAPQVQQLRELRDNSLLKTESGTSFMESFNDFYYSFSPLIADYERENPVFKEMVKIAITPMISSLSILNYVNMDSESEVLGYGISLILLNIGMYVAIPAVVIVGIRKRF